MPNRRRLVVAAALAAVVALIAGLILTSGRGQDQATKPAASVTVLSPFTGEQVAALREAGGYFRNPARPAPHNLYAHAGRLLDQASAPSKAHDIGFRFGPAPAGGHARQAQSVSYPAASFTFTWSADGQEWLVSMDRAPAASTDGGRLSAATVVIQYTTVGTSRFAEAGARPPYARTTGSGDALVLRNGQAFDARWSRPDAGGGTTFTTGSGRPMTFAPGPVWVVLVPAADR